MKTMRNLLLGVTLAMSMAGTAGAVELGGQSMAPMALNSLSSPPDKIATAKVVDEMGTIVGAVQKVELDQSGKPTRVEIALLGSDQIIALDSSRLSYDASNNVVTAALDKSQLVQMTPHG